MFLKYGALIILLLSSLAIARGNPSDSLTIDQAIQMVTENHPLVLGAMQGVASSDAGLPPSQQLESQSLRIGNPPDSEKC